MNRPVGIATILAVVMALAAFPAVAADDSTVVTIDLPVETARLQPGPGVEVATAACMVCHSVDYIYMQPPLTKDQWRAEVGKMKHVFGAPFPEQDIDTIVTYLMSQNGRQ